MTNEEIITKLDSCIQQLDEVKDFLTDEQINHQPADKQIANQLRELKQSIDIILNCKIDYINTANIK